MSCQFAICLLGQIENGNCNVMDLTLFNFIGFCNACAPFNNIFCRVCTQIIGHVALTELISQYCAIIVPQIHMST